MSSNVEGAQTDSLRTLVRKLIEEHRDFSSKVQEIDQRIEDSELTSLVNIFHPLRDSLIDHMLVEESEIFPEVSNRGLFTERISEIMQQHLEITAALDEMRSSIHRKDFQKLKVAFDELVRVLCNHFPAEEKEVFSLVI